MFKKYVNQEKIIKSLQELIRIPSVYSKSKNPNEPFGKNTVKALNYALELGKKLGFRTKNIDAFVKTYGDESLSKMDVLTEVMDKLDEAFENIKIPVTSIPMVLYSGYRVKKVRKSFSKFVELIVNFLNDYDNNEEYKKYVQSGTGSAENVKGRLEYWKNMIKEL